MDQVTLASQRLLRLVEPYCATGDLDGLAAALHEEWSADCLMLLLDHFDPEVVRYAVLCLGLIASAGAAGAIAALLHHPDDSIAATAEDALWSISFQSGGALPQAVLSKIAKSLKSGETENVVSMLNQLIKSHPTYAEAYHQRAQAYYLQHAYESALRDARRAHAMNPYHFSALALQGHSMVALSRLREGLEIYRRVQALHPRMAGIRECVEQLRGKLNTRRTTVGA